MYEFDSGKSETISRLPALAYSPRKLSKRPGPSHNTQADLAFALSPQNILEVIDHLAAQARAIAANGGWFPE
jgi:hypothetical protein